MSTSANPTVTANGAYSNIAPAGGDTATPLNLEKRLRVIQRYAPVAGKRVLDCGCGAGDYVLALMRRGGDAWGVEYSRQKLATSPGEVAGRLSAGSCLEARRHVADLFAEPTVSVRDTRRVLEAFTPPDLALLPVPSVPPIAVVGSIC